MQGDFLAAAHHFKETTRHEPARAGAYINLGAIYNRLGRYDDAIATLHHGIDLDPHRGEGYYNLGLVHRHLEHWHLAIEAYKEAVRVSPNMADAHFNLANLLLEQYRYDSAIIHYNHALRLRPDWDLAQQGLEMAKEARAEAEMPGDDAPKPSASKESNASLRHADPKRDAALLTDLTRLSETADALGRELGDEEHSAARQDDQGPGVDPHQARRVVSRSERQARRVPAGSGAFPHVRCPVAGTRDPAGPGADAPGEGVSSA